MRAHGRSDRVSDEASEHNLLLRIAKRQLKRNRDLQRESIRHAKELSRYLAIAQRRFRPSGLRLRYLVIRISLRDRHRVETEKARRMESWIMAQQRNVRRLQSLVDRVERSGDGGDEMSEAELAGNANVCNAERDADEDVVAKLEALAIDVGPKSDDAATKRDDDDDNNGNDADADRTFPKWWPIC